MNRAANTIRVLAAMMVEKAKSGHPGGAMGGADFANVLYSKFLVTDPDDPTWFARDRFFLDPGHMSPMLYSVLALTGKYTVDELKQLRQWGSACPGHPELDPTRGVENTSGPLGQGHTMAVGCAIAERFLQARFGDVVSHKTYAFISDGGIQEEISQGAGRIAGYLGLSNLIMFYDSNRVQLSTYVDAVDREDVAMKYRAWHWNVIEIDGTDPVAIAQALEAARKEEKRPTIIIGNTVMGRGAVKADGSNYEGQCSTHGQPLSAAGADLDKTLANVVKWQDKKTGLWYQVMDSPEREGNYLESTCSSMFSYAMLKAARKGYADKKYLEPGKKAYMGIVNNFIRVNPDKTISLTNCCAVAGLGPGISPAVQKAAPKVKENTRRDGSYAYYLSEPVRDNDAKGVGPFIWASLEMEDLGLTTDILP